MFTPPSEQGSIGYPSDIGAVSWGGVSIIEERQILVVNSLRMPAAARLVLRDKAGEPRDLPLYASAGGPMLGTPLSPSGTPFGLLRSEFPAMLHLGLITAIDLRSKRVLWERPFGTTRDLASLPIALPLGVPSFGGSIITRSRLILVQHAGTHSPRISASLGAASVLQPVYRTSLAVLNELW